MQYQHNLGDMAELLLLNQLLTEGRGTVLWRFEVNQFWNILLYCNIIYS